MGQPTRQLKHLTNARIAQLFEMRSYGGFPPRMSAKDKQAFIKWGMCDGEGQLFTHVLGHLLHLETAQLPVFDRLRDQVTWLAPTEDGTACYVRVQNWEGVRVQFWLMINFPLCMWGIPRPQ